MLKLILLLPFCILVGQFSFAQANQDNFTKTSPERTMEIRYVDDPIEDNTSFYFRGRDHLFFDTRDEAVLYFKSLTAKQDHLLVFVYGPGKEEIEYLVIKE